MKVNLDSDWQALHAGWLTALGAFGQQYKGLVVACSGGLDSTVLFHQLWQFSKEKINFHLAICHINFGLRGKESQRDADFVAALARTAQCPFFGYTVSSSDERGDQNTQVWARNLRYRHFQALADEGWLIALAHHRDDLAESVLLRLARGTSPGAMAGMRVWNPPYWRPFLSLPKSALSAWAKEQGLASCQDSSNAQTVYSRNRIRHDLLPILEELFPGAAQRIGRCAQAAWDLAEFCNRQLAEPIHRLKTTGLDCAWLQGQGEVICGQMISQALGPVYQGRKQLDARFLQRVWQLIHEAPALKHSKQEVQLPARRGKLCVRSARLYLETTEPQQSSAKVRQHQRSLAWRDYSWSLGPEGSRVQFFTARPAGGAQENLCWASKEKSYQHLKAFSPRVDERLRFIGQDRSWTLGELMVLNGIPNAARAHLLLAVDSSAPRIHGDLIARGLWVLYKYKQPNDQGQLI